MLDYFFYLGKEVLICVHQTINLEQQSPPHQKQNIKSREVRNPTKFNSNSTEIGCYICTYPSVT